MSDPARQDACKALIEEWRRTRQTSAPLAADQLKSLTRDLLEQSLRAGCRAELSQASAPYRTMDDYVRHLLEEHVSTRPRLRRGEPADDPLVAEHYLEVWRSYGVPGDHFLSEGRDRAMTFVAAARAQYEGGVVLAEVDRRVVGSLGYQVQIPQFPEVLKTDVRKVGYIWTVYVEPAARGRGIATQMLRHAVAALAEVHCTMIVLHASDAGVPIYANAGFRPGPEMRLKLSS